MQGWAKSGCFELMHFLYLKRRKQKRKHHRFTSPWRYDEDLVNIQILRQKGAMELQNIIIN